MGLPCSLCQRASPHVSTVLGVCIDCLHERFPAARSQVQAVHAKSRAEFDLPLEPPRHPDGVRCLLCSNECLIGEG